MMFEMNSRAEKIAAIDAASYDLVIIGGGIFGACALWEARLRGLSVLLVEAEDFSSGSSADSYKIVHGGIRYMQHLDLPRIWSSSRERSAFLRIAPHLVTPLPILIPTYGWGMLGKPILGAGMLLYDILTLGRNKSIPDRKRRIPLTKFMNREETLKKFQNIPSEGLTGACVFSDGRFYNPTRLVWCFVRSAMSRGAHAINHMRASQLIMQENQVTGLEVEDTITGQKSRITCKSVLNTAGPWAERLLGKFDASNHKAASTYSRDACFVVKRKLPTEYTLALQGKSKDPDALLARPARHLFMSPWRDYTLIGVWHKVTDVDPSEITVDKSEIEEWLDELNSAHPELKIRMDEVSMWNAGLVPFGENEDGQENLSYGKRSLIVDHEEAENVKGLTTLIGVRYTMGRGEAEKALDLVEAKLGRKVNRPGSDHIPLCGGDFQIFEQLVGEITKQLPAGTKADTIRSLAHNYGNEYKAVVDIISKDRSLSKVFENTTVTRAEVVYCCRNEMVESLADLVFRRTDAATAGNPGDQSLQEMLDIAAAELGWPEEQKQQELEKVKQRFPQW